MCPGAALDGTYGQLILQADVCYSYQANRVAAEALTTGEIVTGTFSYRVKDTKNLVDSAELEFTITGKHDNPILVDAIKPRNTLRNRETSPSLMAA